MTYSIENEYLSVTISSTGAELISAVNKKDKTEYIWQGNQKYWTGHSPIMFPICGRLFEGKYTYRNKSYELGCHGFAKLQEFELFSAKETSVSLKLVSNDETRKNYPFDFELLVTYTLKDSTLDVSFKVKNTDSNELIFGIGGHPAFNVPFSKNEKFEDYFVSFDKKAMAIRVDLSDTCFCTGNDKPYMEDGTQDIPLRHEMFDNDAIFLYNIPKSVTLKSQSSKHSVKMTFKDMKYLGLWHKPKTNAPFVCIEPWNSIPSYDGIVDDLQTKKEMVHLPSGYSSKVSYQIEFK